MESIRLKKKKNKDVRLLKGLDTDVRVYIGIIMRTKRSLRDPTAYKKKG